MLVLSRKKLFVRWWRKTALPCVLLMLVGIAVIPWDRSTGAAIEAVAGIWMLTIPCGLQLVNKSPVLWTARQAYFAAFAVLTAIAAFG